MSVRVICRVYRAERNCPACQRACVAPQRRQRTFTTRSEKAQQNQIPNEIGASPFTGLQTSDRTCDPLRILFFGTDDFSVASLKALHEFRDDLGIKSIDVVSKTPRRIGRGLKAFNKAPIKDAAEGLSLPLHEIHGFKSGWEPPRPEDERINLLIAVSFGLLIPGRMIQDAQYGGLNVHPSALPDLRGAAPLHHTLLQRRTDTHVSLQTLHPKKFDHGTVLSQSRAIPIPAEAIKSGSVKTLRDALAPIGAELLVKGIYQRLFMPPLQDAIASEPVEEKFSTKDNLVPAHKITKADKRIDWQNWLAADIVHRQNVLGDLWTMLSYPKKKEGEHRTKGQVRVIVQRVESISDELIDNFDQMDASGEPGTVAVAVVANIERLAVRTRGGQWLLIAQLTVEGDRHGRNPIAALRTFSSSDFGLRTGEIRMS